MANKYAEYQRDQIAKIKSAIVEEIVQDITKDNLKTVFDSCFKDLYDKSLKDRYRELNKYEDYYNSIELLPDIKKLVYCVVIKEYSSNTEVIEELIRCGDDYIDNTNFKETFHYLIEAKPNFETQDKNGNTLLHYVAQYGEAKDVNDLIDNYNPQEIFINTRNKDGNTPLHLAVKSGNAKLCETLIAKGANVNIQDQDGLTPLHLAVWFGHAEICETLIAEGADFNIQDNNGLTPLHLAFKNGHFDTCTKLCDALIKKGANVNIRDRDGYTPLHYAAKLGNAKLCKYLIERGAELDVKNQTDKTPLDLCESKAFKARLLAISAKKKFTDLTAPSVKMIVETISRLGCSKKRDDNKER